MVALLDSGTHMCFISKKKAQALKMHLEELPKSMQVLVINTDGMTNQAGPMKYSTHVIVKYKEHRELIQFLVMETSNSDIVLGYNWLQHHNLNIDWLNGTIKLNCCPTQCLL